MIKDYLHVSCYKPTKVMSGTKGGEKKVKNCTNAHCAFICWKVFVSNTLF